MNYYDREEWPGFLASIRAAPTDDLPRLVAADFLEENGEPERAEFVRVLCHAKKCSPCRSCSQWSRRDCPEPDCVFGLHDRALTTLLDCNFSPTNGLRQYIGSGRSRDGDGVFWERGFLSRVRAPLAALIGRECVRCRSWMENHDCPDCNGTGRTPGVLRELLRREPLGPEGIEVTDMPIFPSGGNSTYYVGGLGRLPGEYWGQLDSQPTESAARLALSRAVYAMCSKSEVPI